MSTQASTKVSISILRDAIAGLVVFLVALPLCLGVAYASGAEPFAGLLAGILGGILVGALSGSSTSVSGPAAGLTAIVAAQIAVLGSFENLLLAIFLAGLIQIGFGIARAGFLSAFVPSSVIKGLLAAIGIILILKQIPHLLGHDTDPEGDMAFVQPDKHNTLSELLTLFQGEIHVGALTIGLTCLLVLVVWERIPFLKKSIVPAPLLVVLVGMGMSLLFRRFGGPWAIEASHLVQIPIADSISDFVGFLKLPNFSQLTEPAVYRAAVTLALVASLETLLNLEAVDKLDPLQRNSPSNRELIAQGVGNTVAGLIGGLPVTSVIVRSSVNIHAGAQTKFSAILHGVFILVSVLFLPSIMNQIPISCLAAILLVTGFKLAGPKLFKEMWKEGKYQFLPFLVTLLAIVFTDLLIGIIIGLVISIAFILNSNLRRPLRRIVERHVGGDVLRIELASQVSFLNRAKIEEVLWSIPRGQHVLLDAHNTDYIDPDILALIRDFKDHSGPIRGVRVSLKGFRDKYQLDDQIEYIDYSTKQLQQSITPADVLRMLKAGNERFRNGKPLSRDWSSQMDSASRGQHPLAVVLGCMDSRIPVEVVLDVGMGDVFCVRIAGNVVSERVLGSMEYGVQVAGARLILVLGHTMCGAVTAAVQWACRPENAAASGCDNLPPLVEEIQQSIATDSCRRFHELDADRQAILIDAVAAANVRHSVQKLLSASQTIRRLVDRGEVAVVGAIYHIGSGQLEFLSDTATEPKVEFVAEAK